MEGNTPFRLWRCDNCDVELDEADGYIPHKMGQMDFCDYCYNGYIKLRENWKTVVKEMEKKP